ncbi:Stp1/IreP family PP2C-type Ser/Thr phosphatase [Myxococcota bacterium]|nr:Stp1/IreP family PP2C-type Ser/Thr phosphatase [Myxococcota bacterium]MBU1382093.1 Stp1/IreP family PP2C-type Ser/Thr phosphatase [Myxococcota bacterium]MBU1498096.1 Stp1/IreP family PP2C-type Ser/Thr phosphatase [Myxococcota bacterium]
MALIESFALTDVGMQRDHNEDSHGYDTDLNLFIVADGMGGHAAGEVASALAVEEVKKVVLENRDLITGFAKGNPEYTKYDILMLLEQAVQSACLGIFREAQKDPDKRGMGTTCDALLVINDRGYIVHVGDSRVYLMRQGKVHQLTVDHSLMNELVRRGKFTKEEFLASPYAEQKNALTRAVGVYESIESDTFDFPVLPGDNFLLCSDGLSAYLDDILIDETFRDEDLERVAKRFIQIANEGGGHDNITALVVRMPMEGDMQDAINRAAEINLSLDVLKDIKLFKHLNYQELVLVHNFTELRSFSPGAIIVREGDIGEELFIIVRGKVRVEINGRYIGMLADRTHFGEMALVDKQPRSATVIADTPAKILVLKKKDFFQIIRDEHRLATKLLWSFIEDLTTKLRNTTTQLRDVMEAEDINEDLTDDLVED